MQTKTTVTFWTRFRYRLIIHLLSFFISCRRLVSSRFQKRIGLLPDTQSVKPSQTISIPSSVDPRRKISLHIYYPSNKLEDGTIDGSKLPLPVHISFHGSGFCLPIHGMDAEKCTRQASELGCIVIDADYAKTTSYSYPACVEDALDVLAYVKSNPTTYDASRITSGGYSSGAYVALELAFRSPGEIKALILWYGVIDLSIPYDERPAKRPKTDLKSSILSPDALHMFVDALIPDGADLEDPLVNPARAPSSSFPPTVFIVSYFKNRFAIRGS